MFEDIKRDKGKRTGLLATLIFHLSLLIVLLVVSIGRVVAEEASFVLDFTKQEQLEEEQKEIELKEEVAKALDEMIASNSPRSNVRNVAVDGSKLRDDRHRNPSEVYEEAKALQRKLDASRRDAMAQRAADDAVDMEDGDSSREKVEESRPYSGPSVVSYDLEGRKAISLPIPAYKGYGAGDVLVSIVVNEQGRVVEAAVVASQSSSDRSLYEYAISAARRSRFSKASGVPSQQGSILYRFIAQ